MTFVGNVRIAIRLPQDCWRSKRSLVSSPVSDEEPATDLCSTSEYARTSDEAEDLGGICRDSRTKPSPTAYYNSRGRINAQSAPLERVN